jgi:hypothetical protein
VVLKATRNAGPNTEASPEKPDELGILKYLHSSPYTGHICNHAIPLLGSISMPDPNEGSFAVLPLLRMHDDPPFLNVSEAVEFLKQILRVRRHLILDLSGLTIILGTSVYACAKCSTSVSPYNMRALIIQLKTAWQ